MQNVSVTVHAKTGDMNTYYSAERGDHWRHDIMVQRCYRDIIEYIAWWPSCIWEYWANSISTQTREDWMFGGAPGAYVNLTLHAMARWCDFVTVNNFLFPQLISRQMSVCFLRCYMRRVQHDAYIILQISHKFRHLGSVFYSDRIHFTFHICKSSNRCHRQFSLFAIVR